MPIDFLTVGHITHDRAPEGFRLGGTVSFAAVTALRLGRRPGIVTRGSAELLHDGADTEMRGYHGAPPASPLSGIPIRLLPSPVSTTFTNTYRGGHRTQILEALAEPIQPDEPYATLDNVTLSNHRGGDTVNCYSDSPAMLLCEATKLLAGKEPKFFANKNNLK